MKKILFALLFILLCALNLSSCKRDKVPDIELDNTDPLALAVDIEWAVINEPFVVFRESHEWASKDVGHGKRGEILRVMAYSYSSENEKWVKFEKGFLPLKSVLVFSNRFQANSTSKGMIEQ